MPLRLWQREVERRMASDGFTSTEDWINGATLRDDIKSALWLLAWSLQPGPAQRVEAEATIRELEAICG